MKPVATLLLLSALATGQTVLSVRSTLPSNGPTDTRALDLNGDGRPDLLTLGGDGLAVRLNDGSGNFPANATVYPLNISSGLLLPTRSYATGDFNRDGRIDVVAVTDRGTYFYAGDGKGAFASVRPTSIQSEIRTLSVVAADFNGDGNLDLAFSFQLAGVRIYLAMARAILWSGRPRCRAEYPALPRPRFRWRTLMETESLICWVPSYSIKPSISC